MRNPLIGVLTASALLAAGAAYAADAPAAVSAPAATPSTAPAHEMTTTTTSTTTEVSKAGSVTGVVKSFDAKTRMLTLKDDSMFILDKSLTGSDLKADQSVKLTFKTDADKKIVTHYEMMKS